MIRVGERIIAAASTPASGPLGARSAKSFDNFRRLLSPASPIAASIAAVHLSRLAEEIVIWTSPLTALVKLSDKFTTGSSIMPQKRNPDAAELVRAKAGRIIGALSALLIVMKGLPLAYAKDMQEDKEGAMDALAALLLSVAAMTGMVADLEPDTSRMKKAAAEGYATATDLADWLVRTLKIPFREAHHLTGRIVAKAAETNVPLHRLPLAVMQEVEPRISENVFTVLPVDRSVKSRVSFGGTAPKNVRSQATRTAQARSSRATDPSSRDRTSRETGAGRLPASRDRCESGAALAPSLQARERTRSPCDQKPGLKSSHPRAG